MEGLGQPSTGWLGETPADEVLLGIDARTASDRTTGPMRMLSGEKDVY